MVKFIDNERFNQIDSVNITQIVVTLQKVKFCLIENADKSIFMLVCSIKIVHAYLKLIFFDYIIYHIHQSFNLPFVCSLSAFTNIKKISSHFIGTSNFIPPIK